MEAYLKPVPKPCAKKIYEHMENYLYKINEKEGNYEIGFFIRLKDEKDKSHLALVTSPNVLKDIDSNSLKITLDHEPKPIELGDIRYEDKIYGKAVIEIKESSEIEYFFEIDEDIFANEEERKMKFNKESIYIIQYDNKDNISVSYGIINNTYGKVMNYSVNTNKNIKDNIILNLKNNKIIGILDDTSKNGTFINDLIARFVYKDSCISFTFYASEDQVNKYTYFLDNNYLENDTLKETHHHLRELNENNTELYIDGNKTSYKKYFKPKKEGEYKIELKFHTNLTDCSYMFSGCGHITYFDFSNFNTKNIKNMRFMFGGCSALPDISKWDTRNVEDMSGMFCDCTSLNSLPDISKWNTSNVKDMSYMFNLCILLNSLPDISKWDTSKVTNMKGMFKGYGNRSDYSFSSLPDISKWNTSKVKDMSYMFYGCITLNSLPDISKWNTSNVDDMSWMFYACNSLNSLPEISKWNTSNVKNMMSVFESCRLKSLPDISKWNTSNVENMMCMFSYCGSLNSLPDISKWNTSNVKNMSYMFRWCNSLNSLPDISKWITSNVENMRCMFWGCESLNSLPDISKWNTGKVKNMGGMFDDCKPSLNIPPKFRKEL